MKQKNLFRGQRIDNGEWVEGYYHLAHGIEHRIYELGYVNTCPYEIVRPETVSKFSEMYDGTTWDELTNWEQILFERSTVDKSIPASEQWTGKKIWEGDKIEHYAFCGYVVFEDGMFSISSNAKSNFEDHRQPMCYHNTREMKVVGTPRDVEEQLVNEAT